MAIQARKTFSTLDRATLNFLQAKFLSLKSAASDVIGTNRKPDVLRVLRTQGLLEYSETGFEHEISLAGYQYFCSDKDRRAQSDGFPLAKLPEIWNTQAGSEVFISGRSALELKRDHFDARMMAIIDPPRPSRIKGLRMEQLLPLLDEPDMETETPDETEQSEDLGEYWTAKRVKLAVTGNDAGARALDFLTARRTKVFINELAHRAGVPLDDLSKLEKHLHSFCSFRMRLMLDSGAIFDDRKMLNLYLQDVAESSFETVFGYSPELVAA